MQDATNRPRKVAVTGCVQIAEHGGMNADDRSVVLLLSAPDVKPASVTALVQTTQIAPTILKALGYDPNELEAVRLEKTPVLPGLPF